MDAVVAQVVSVWPGMAEAAAISAAGGPAFGVKAIRRWPAVLRLLLVGLCGVRMLLCSRATDAAWVSSMWREASAGG